jgi:hypothetical protein
LIYTGFDGRLFVPDGRLFVPDGRLFVPDGRLFVPDGGYSYLMKVILEV